MHTLLLTHTCLRYTGNILEVPPLEDQTSDEAKYKMQLVDDDFQAMEDYIDTVPRKSIK
jgi:hypothetical protein